MKHTKKRKTNKKMNRHSVKYKTILNDQVLEQLEFLKEKGQKKYF